LVGSIIGYSIGYFLEENLLLSLIKKYGKFILVTEHDYQKGNRLDKETRSTGCFCRQNDTGVKSFVAIAAGITEVKFTKFIISNVLAALIYVSAVSYFGFYLGSKWNTFGIYFRQFEVVIVILVILAGLGYINYKLKIIKFKK